MKQYIAHVSLIVDDYDDAIAFYTQKIGFELIEDTKLNAEKRWVLVKPKGATETAILLAKASNTEQESRIGNQTGGRVFYISLY
jgi:catechol 2,3-dioxygenase-like lactoylglutathione lyase family enzyme